jgi:hypothetical protein
MSGLPRMGLLPKTRRLKAPETNGGSMKSLVGLRLSFGNVVNNLFI